MQPKHHLPAAIFVRVPPSTRKKLDAMRAKLTRPGEADVTLSDVVRMAIERGLPLLDAA